MFCKSANYNQKKLPKPGILCGINVIILTITGEQNKIKLEKGQL